MMKRKVTLLIMTIWILVSPSYLHQQEDDYVDPTDLINFDSVNVRMKSVRKHGTVIVDMKVSPKNIDAQTTPMEPSLTERPFLPESDSLQFGACDQNRDAATFQECSNSKHSLESFIALFRQYVNKLVHILEYKVDKASNPIDINLRLRVSYHDISKLREFGQGGSNEIHDVHETLSHMIQHTSDILQPESGIYWLEMRTGLSSAVLMQISIIIVSITMLLKLLSRRILSKTMLSGALFVVSFIFTWIEMYQKEVANQEQIFMTHKLNEYCPKIDELSYWGRLATFISSTFTFENERCKDYFQAMLVNPVVKISPLEVVAVVIVKVVVTPLGIIGSGIKAFFIGLLKDLPAQYQIFVITVFFAFVLLALFFSCGYHLKIFGLVTLGPANIQQHFHQAAITNQRVNTSEMHQRTIHVPARTLEGISSSRSNVVKEEMCYLNDSVKMEQTNQHIEIVTNNTHQSDDLEKDPVVQNVDINVAAGTSLRTQQFKNSTTQESEVVNADTDAEFLAKKIKDLTVATSQEHETEMSLPFKINNVNISSYIDKKDIQYMQQE